MYTLKNFENGVENGQKMAILTIFLGSKKTRRDLGFSLPVLMCQAGQGIPPLDPIPSRRGRTFSRLDLFQLAGCPLSFRNSLLPAPFSPQPFLFFSQSCVCPLLSSESHKADSRGNLDVGFFGLQVSAHHPRNPATASVPPGDVYQLDCCDAL